jgi:hypothetical protein
MSSQPHKSPGLESQDPKKDPTLEPVAEETVRRLVEGAEQQVGAGEQNEPPDVTAYDPQTTKEGQAKEPEGRQAGEKTERIITGAEQQVGTGEQGEAPETGAYDPRATKEEEEDAELDDALEGTFPASDPPSQTSKSRPR